MALILDQTSITGDVYSNTIYPNKNKCIAGTYSYNVGAGDLVAALVLQCSDEFDPSYEQHVGWVTESTHSFSSDPGGVAGEDEFNFANCNHKAYRIMVDFTSGDGPMKINDSNN